MGIQQALFAAIGSVLPGYLRAIYNTTTAVVTALRGGAISTGTIVGNASNVTPATVTPGFTAVDTTLSTDAISIA